MVLSIVQIYSYTWVLLKKTNTKNRPSDKAVKVLGGYSINSGASPHALRSSGCLNPKTKAAFHTQRPLPLPENLLRLLATVRGRQRCIHTCVDYWYDWYQNSFLSSAPFCITLACEERMSLLVFWSHKSTCYGQDAISTMPKVISISGGKVHPEDQLCLG